MHRPRAGPLRAARARSRVSRVPGAWPDSCTRPAGRALGYQSVWTAEAYGSDARSLLATLAAVTRGIKLGIKVPGPQIVEGWYGEPWGRPYLRLKDYAAIIREIWAREAPVTDADRQRCDAARRTHATG